MSEAKSVTIRPIRPGDRQPWATMRHALYGGSHSEHEAETRAFFSGECLDVRAVYVAESQHPSQLIGFIELNIRNYVEGASSNRVAYLEGWWVDPARRRRGIGRKLVEQAVRWARGQGCRELASDADLTNTGSIAAHQSLGFAETDRIVCFLRTVDGTDEPEPAIRPISETDIPDLFRLRIATWENDRGAEELENLGITPQSVAEKLHTTHCGWIATCGPESVGFAMGNRKTGELWVIAVLPEFEGRGIGRRLMAAVENDLAKAGWNEIWLTTYRDDSWRAVGFYRRLGWKDWKIDDDRYMRKDLS